MSELESLQMIGDRWIHGNHPDEPTLSQSTEGRITLNDVAKHLRVYGYEVERRGNWLNIDGESVTGTAGRGLLRWQRFKESKEDE